MKPHDTGSSGDRYVIRDVNGAYWSREHGWTAFEDDADEFDGDEQRTLSLPDGGSWHQVSPTCAGMRTPRIGDAS